VQGNCIGGFNFLALSVENHWLNYEYEVKISIFLSSNFAYPKTPKAYPVNSNRLFTYYLLLITLQKLKHHIFGAESFDMNSFWLLFRQRKIFFLLPPAF